MFNVAFGGSGILNLLSPMAKSLFYVVHTAYVLSHISGNNYIRVLHGKPFSPHHNLLLVIPFQFHPVSASADQPIVCSDRHWHYYALRDCAYMVYWLISTNRLLAYLRLPNPAKSHMVSFGGVRATV